MSRTELPNGRLDYWITENLRFWLQVDMSKDFVSLLTSRIDFFKKCLTSNYPNYLARGVIKLVQAILAKCNSRSRYCLTTLLKRIQPRLTQAKIFTCNDRNFCDEFSDIKTRLGAPGIDWNGHRAAICISHDIDYQRGFEFSVEMARLDNQFGIPSVFNVLTQGDYSLNSEFIAQLKKQNAEIGLHGATHDIGFGYLKRGRIENDLTRAISSLPAKVSGFRAPALSFSYELISILNNMGFEYDSSFRAFDKKTGQVKVFFPFRYPSLSIWELPVTVQDTDFFRDMRLSDDESFKLLRYLVEKVISCGGVAVFNFHPCIMRENIAFYLRFLEHLNGTKKNGVWFTTMGELVRFLKAAMPQKKDLFYV